MMDPISSSENAANLTAPPTAHSLGQKIVIVIFFKRRKKYRNLFLIYCYFPTEIPREKKKLLFSKRKDVACLPFINYVKQQHARQYI